MHHDDLIHGMSRHSLTVSSMSTTAIEMGDLSGKRSTSTEPTAQDDDPRTEGGSISLWAWSSALTLALFSICLLASPRLLLFLAEPGRATLTSLEKYLALLLGIVLGTLAAAIVALLPNGWPTAPRRTTTNTNSHPLLRPVTAASLVIALLSSENRSVGSLATAVLLGSSLVGMLGLWMLVFPGPPTISHRTGADKRTSSFIFGNKSAASVKKRLWKKGHQIG